MSDEKVKNQGKNLPYFGSTKICSDTCLKKVQIMYLYGSDFVLPEIELSLQLNLPFGTTGVDFRKGVKKMKFSENEICLYSHRK